MLNLNGKRMIHFLPRYKGNDVDAVVDFATGDHSKEQSLPWTIGDDDPDPEPEEPEEDIIIDIDLPQHQKDLKKQEDWL